MGNFPRLLSGEFDGESLHMGIVQAVASYQIAPTESDVTAEEAEAPRMPIIGTLDM